MIAGQAGRIKLRKGDMSDHHAVDGIVSRGCKFSEDLEFMRFKFGQRPGECGEFMVGIARCRGVAGEVLAAGEDSGGLHRAVKDAGHFNDLIRSGAVAPPAKGVIRLVIKGDVEHGTEVEIKSEKPEQFPGERAMPCDQDRISFLTQLSGIGRFIAQKFEPGDPSSFLVDGDDRLDGAEFAELIGEPAELCGCLNIAAKENESPRLNPADEIGIFRIH